ncbi:NADPH-glutathione reductase, partial [Thioclava sp. BHET1]
HILIATGGTPFVPEDIPGHELAITSNEVFLWDEMPKRMLIVGGGYIACEFACILNGLGAEVTQYYRGEQILRGFDREVRDHISAAMSASGIDLRLGTNVTAMEKTATGIRATATDGTVQEFDAVLYATGRNPNSKGLGLEALGVSIAASGAIEVDEYS